MLEVGRFHAGVTECHASARALEALAVPAGVVACRVAPDELLLVSDPERRAEILRRASGHFAVVDPGALVVDASDGWTIFGLPGEAGLLALRQLSLLPIPERRPAFVQGSVAGGPAKLLFGVDTLHLLVPYALRDHVEARLRDCFAPGSVRVAASESPFAAGGRR